MAAGTPLDLMTLRSLYSPYRDNPHNTRLKLLEGVANESGLASPGIAYLQGREAAAGEDWETKREDEQRAAAEQAAEAGKIEAASAQEKRKFDQLKTLTQAIKDLEDAGMHDQIVPFINDYATKSGLQIPKLDGISLSPKIKEFHVAQSKDATGKDIYFGITDRGQIYVREYGEDGKTSVRTPDPQEFGQIMTQIKEFQNKDRFHLQNVPAGGDMEKTVKINTATGAIEETGYQGRRWKPGGEGDAIAKVGLLNAVKGMVADSWADEAIKNAKAQGIQNIKEEFSDPMTGSVNPSKVRLYLNDDQKRMYDWHMEKSQSNAKSMAPAAAEQSARNEMLSTFKVNQQPKQPAGNPVADKSKQELIRRGLLK